MRKLSRKFYNEKGYLQAKYIEALETRKGFKFYTEYQTGSGRWRNYLSSSFELLQIFVALKIGYEKGNDSPRGGRSGDYVIINQICLNRIRKIKFKWEANKSNKSS